MHHYTEYINCHKFHQQIIFANKILTISEYLQTQLFDQYRIPNTLFETMQLIFQHQIVEK